MHIQKHGEHLIQLERLMFVNCYLVREDDGFTLVDTGMWGSAKEIVEVAKQYGAPIKRIVLTHAHLDHVGSLDALHALIPNAEVMISARDARFLTGDKSLDLDEPQTPLKGGYPLVKTVPTRLLQSGDKVGSLQVIASPGHTPGHVAYWDPRERVLLAGDAYSTKAGTSTGGTFRLLFPFPAMATWHKPSAIRSAETLVALKPKWLATGHGKVLENPVTSMQSAIDEAKRKTGVTTNGGSQAG
jgi:glyoxylase-like metal-dependent hydrolase (beta-lactamase superfamily II)